MVMNLFGIVNQKLELMETMSKMESQRELMERY